MSAHTSSLPTPIFAGIRKLLPGFMLCAVIAISATFVSEHYGGPQFLYALLIGIAFHFLSDSEKCIPGIEASAKKLVRFGKKVVKLEPAHIGDPDVAAALSEQAFGATSRIDAIRQRLSF